MVIPRSCSISMLSSTWLVISRSVSPPVDWISRSASVLFPWSICAMMEKFRIRFSSVMIFDFLEDGGALAEGVGKAKAGAVRAVHVALNAFRRSSSSLFPTSGCGTSAWACPPAAQAPICKETTRRRNDAT
jgi:hypothetical protein